MARHVISDIWIAINQCPRNRRKLLILRIGIRQRIGAFQLNPNRKIIAAFAPLILRDSGMPGTFIERNILDYFTIAANQTVSGDAQMGDLSKERMCLRINSSSE